MSEQKTRDFSATYAHVVSRAWAEPEFKERLLASPMEVLGELGVEVPEGMTVHVVENTPQQTYFVLPRNQNQASLSNRTS